MRLQSNHYGIETRKAQHNTHEEVSLQSNHYGIETQVMKRRLIFQQGSCNRTIMVLKLFWLCWKRLSMGEVAIEPLWYWNLNKWQNIRKLLLSCNRTIMVLKRLGMVWGFIMSWRSCNRTIMVLKHPYPSSKVLPTYTPVAIEPLWYWNLVN